MMVRSAGNEIGGHHLTPLKEFRSIWPNINL
jgi:hypothetical protein